jgi:tetratricopeptide (TPR) repeat protein
MRTLLLAAIMLWVLVHPLTSFAEDEDDIPLIDSRYKEQTYQEEHMPYTEQNMRQENNNNSYEQEQKEYEVEQTEEKKELMDYQKQAVDEPAPTTPPSPPAPKISQETLDQLKERMNANPQDLDAYFQYGQASTAAGNFEDAEIAYKHMLDVNPELHRIKLDLGLVSMRIGDFKQAKSLFEQVLDTNPPQEVKENILRISAIVDKNLQSDVFSASATTGYSHSSNANSAAATGETTFANVSIPLAANSRAQHDGQFFGAATLSHMHRFDIDSRDWGLSLNTTGTFYQTKQQELSNLDLKLYSVKVGPTLDLKKLKMQLGFSTTQSIIYLHNQNYIKSPSADVTWKYAPFDNLILDYDYAYEYRHFYNTTDSSSNTDRTGNASQNKIGVTYVFTPQDIFNASLTLRTEEARYKAFGNMQTGIMASYTRILPWDMAVNAMFGYKESEYDEADDTVSSLIIRKDRERTMAYTLVKKLPLNLNLTFSYQYKNADSNLQNYTYIDHKYSTAVGWAFSL